VEVTQTTPSTLHETEMSMDVNARATVEPLNFPTDARGLVVEPLRPDEFAAQRNAHLVLTVPGGIRGNHYHKTGSEVCLVLGPALIRVRDADGLLEYPLDVGEAARFTFPPGVPHAILNTGTEPLVILSFNTEAHDPDHPDVVREVLIEPR
jgi:UDP-2-acetamido-2,6-beta-L-arabino-hexul-4-ose reductase